MDARETAKGVCRLVVGAELAYPLVCAEAHGLHRGGLLDESAAPVRLHVERDHLLEV